MVTTAYQTSPELMQKGVIERWYFTGMAIAMLAVSVAGFLPAIVNPAGRRAPLSPLAATHGIIFFAWLLLFLIQSLLVANRRVAWHRRLGLASAFVLPLMIPLGYAATVAMVRRGFDLSGDQKIEFHPRAGFLDPYNASIFNFGDLLLFTILVVAAICSRRRPEIHKRLMLFANIALMGAPIVHLLGHTSPALLTPAIVVVPFTIFLLAAVARDYITAKRIHPLTAGLAIAMFASYPIRGILLGPSLEWRQFCNWLIR
jgi:hypothetical protein